MKRIYSNLILFLFLPLFFVLFSFYPTYFEILNKKNIPADREFTLDHNYVFDFNFYLSRIGEGQEGRWLVSEKYYHKEHPPSLFQVVYLYMGKVGGLFGLEPTTIYHSARIILGWILLLSILGVLSNLWGIRKSIPVFLLIVTAGSWPILVKVTEGINILGFRSATYMGWWSSQDSLSRITYIPHVLIGQIFLLWLIKCHSEELATKNPVGFNSTRDPSSTTLRSGFRMTLYGILGFVAGIIFPPTLVIMYAWFSIQSSLEILHILSGAKKDKEIFISYIRQIILPRFIFCLISFLSFVYLQIMFHLLPWSTLATFDIRHRMPLPFWEYILSLGPVFEIGLLGGFLVLLKREKSFYPFVSWIAANFLLIFLFWNVPTQSPLRFTQSAIYIPSGLLAGYLFLEMWKAIRRLPRIISRISQISLMGAYGIIVITGLFVMVSMVGWLTDQVVAKRMGTFLYPTGAVLIYPTKDFMNGIYFLRDQTNQKSVILAAETAGNFIPAYAGNYVYYGHANTPDDDLKKSVIEKFFSGKMSENDASTFLKDEGIKYIYFGPQEREFVQGKDLTEFYPFLREIYHNQTVLIYRM